MANKEPGWDLYRSFLAVLRLGSLSAAGRSLGLSQPTIGRHIGMLQASLGGRVLFTRSQSGLMPTAAAHELRAHAEVVGVEVLPAILSEFRYQYPNTVIELAVSNQMADLLRRDADIAVRMVRPKQKALLAKHAGTIVLGFYAHRRYLERYGYPERLEDLVHHTLIGFDRVAPAADFLKGVPIPVSRELFAFRCDNDLALLAALRSGFGVGICHRSIARRDPDLLPLLVKHFKVELEIWIVMHNELKRISRMRLMFDHLALHLAQYAAPL
jgi:DNA-binding transcriptional LysR family regulator